MAKIDLVTGAGLAAAALGQGEMGRIHYVTHFDQSYLTRGLALYDSLRRHSPPFVLWVLCLDDATRRTLEKLRLEDLRLVPLADLERDDSELLAVKSTREAVEYYWTCGPALLLYLFQNHPEITDLVLVDADLYFFSRVEPIFEELGDGAILLIEDRRVRPANDVRYGGRFNVGLMIFRRGVGTLACVRRWREQCLEWCYDRYEPGRYGDQAYLDAWPEAYHGVRILGHLGANVGPWNFDNHPITRRLGQVFIGEVPLIFYHFSKVSRIHRWLYELHVWRFHRAWMVPHLRRHIYAPYIRALYAAERQMRSVGFRPVRRDRVASGPAWRKVNRALRKGAPWWSPMPLQRFMFVWRLWTL